MHCRRRRAPNGLAAFLLYGPRTGPCGRIGTELSWVGSHTQGEVAKSRKVGSGVLRQEGPRVRNRQVRTAYLVFRFMQQPIYLRSFGMKPKGDVTHPGVSCKSRNTPAASWQRVPPIATHQGRVCQVLQTRPWCVRRRVPTRRDLSRSCNLGTHAYQPTARRGSRLRHARPPRGLAPALSPPPDRRPVRACACRGQTSRAASASRSGP